MSSFTPLTSEPGAALEEAEQWLRARLESECQERDPGSPVTWSIRAGRRETGPADGILRPAQVGFLICLCAAPDAVPHALSCFIPAEDIPDPEQRPVVEQVLSLWLDRVLG